MSEFCCHPCFSAFLLTPEQLRAIADCGCDHPSEMQRECIPLLLPLLLLPLPLLFPLLLLPLPFLLLPLPLLLLALLCLCRHACAGVPAQAEHRHACAGVPVQACKAHARACVHRPEQD